MYCPCSFKPARRAGESLSLRPRRAGLVRFCAAASSAGTRSVRDRAIDSSDRRMAWTLLPIDFARGLGKLASLATRANHTRWRAERDHRANIDTAWILRRHI